MHRLPLCHKVMGPVGAHAARAAAHWTPPVGSSCPAATRATVTNRRSLLVAQAITHKSPECPHNTVGGDFAPDGIATLPPTRTMLPPRAQRSLPVAHATTHTQESQESLSSPCNGRDCSGCVSERPLSGRPHASAHRISDVPLSTGGGSMQHSCVGHSGPGPVCQGGRTVHCSKNVRLGVRVYYLNCAASGVRDVLAVGWYCWAVL
jgi:hypothetical protein